MATLDEKRLQLIALLGGDESLADSVLKQVSQKEADADAQQLAFKEAKEPLETQTEKAAPAESEDEEDDFEDEEDTEDEEDYEGEEDEDEDMEEEEEKEYDPEFLGDVPADKFYDRLAEALSTVMYPIIEEVKELKAQVSISLKERSDGSQQAAAETAALKEKLDAQEKELVKLRKSVKSLQGDVPQGARQFLASQSDDTVISTDRAKELGAPMPDPLSDFAAFALGKQQ